MRIIWITGPERHRTRTGAGAIIGAASVILVSGAVLGGLGVTLWQKSHESVAEMQAHQVEARLLLDRIHRQDALIAEQQAQVEYAQAYTRHHLDALGKRLGVLQAEVTRLNAFGRRLTSVAGLEGSEFDPDGIPGMGGPAPLVELQPKPDLMGATELLDSLEDLSSQLEHNRAQISVLESLILDRKLGAAQVPDVWPTSEGWISSGYGYRIDPFTGSRSFHSGIDIAASAGADVKAVATGVVAAVDHDAAYGLRVEIHHGNGYVTRYAHLKAAVVGVGDKVEKGAIVGTVGQSGRSTGPHLHFEVMKDSRSVNPGEYLQTALK